MYADWGVADRRRLQRINPQELCDQLSHGNRQQWRLPTIDEVFAFYQLGVFNLSYMSETKAFRHYRMKDDAYKEEKHTNALLYPADFDGLPVLTQSLRIHDLARELLETTVQYVPPVDYRPQRPTTQELNKWIRYPSYFCVASPEI